MEKITLKFITLSGYKNLMHSDQMEKIYIYKKELTKMSLELVSNLSNEIGKIVDVDGNLWFEWAHVERDHESI